jgi:hypothetical protein
MGPEDDGTLKIFLWMEKGREKGEKRNEFVMQWQEANITRPDTPDKKKKDNLRVPLDSD